MIIFSINIREIINFSINISKIIKFWINWLYKNQKVNNNTGMADEKFITHAF
jgi:hypothetical protein